MAKQSREPRQLRKGKEFHKAVADDWRLNAEGKIKREKTVLKKNGRKGRVDVFVNDEDPEAIVAIVEPKL